MPAQLVSLTEGQNIVLDKPIILVGRHPECDIQIDSRKISRRHCCVAQVNDYLIVRDLGSTNGIRINGVRVLEGRLKEGDELTIGGSSFRVSWEDTPEPVPRQSLLSKKSEAEPSAYDQDDALESCDEPIALAEPFLGQKSLPHSKSKQPRPRAKAPDHAPSPPAGPRIIPDQIGLAPVSDADLLPPGSSSH